MEVKSFFGRLKREFAKMNLLQASLDAIIFFLTANLVLSLFSVQLTSVSNLWSIGAVTAVFFLSDLIYRLRKYRLEIYEEKNPALHEILRTARDNMYREDIGSRALFNDLLDRSRRYVSADSIIPSKQVIYKILVVGGLSFLVVLSGLTDFHLQEDQLQLLPDVETLTSGLRDGDDEFELRNSSEIFGDRQNIDASSLLLDFNITGTGESEEARNTDLEIYESSEEELVLEVSGGMVSDDLELARRYSLAIKELG